MSAQKVSNNKPAGHHVTFKEEILGFLINCILDGKHPLLHISDINSMHEIAAELRSQGYTVYTLKAEDRNSKSGIQLGSMYQSIVNTSALPYGDAYITTSWIETGISIHGMTDNDGHRIPDELIIPVYVIQNKWEADIDRINQFFVRLRFTYIEAVIIRSDAFSKPDHHSFLSEESVSFYVHEHIRALQSLANTFNTTSYRSDMITLSGMRETDEIYFSGDSFKVDSGSIISRMITESYSAMLSGSASEVCQYLETEYGVPVEAGILSSQACTSIAEDYNPNVSPKISNYLFDTIREKPQETVQALLSPQGINKSFFKEVVNEEGGAAVLQTLRPLLVSDAYSVPEAIDTAIALVENNTSALPDKNSRLLIIPKQHAADQAIRQLAS